MDLGNISVVLVEPSHPGNIGGAARAMKTMGLRDLALVRPKRFPDPQAEWRAAGARDLLDAVKVFDSVDQAIADLHWVVGTSTRVRRIPWPLKSVESVAADVLDRASSQRIGILFGRETSGLSNAELQRCHCHLQIPANPDYSSLNLAMAVQVVCYELYKQFTNESAEGGIVRTDDWDRAPATSEQTEALLTHFESVLIQSGFLNADNPGQTMTRLRRMLNRITPDETEVQMLRGILKQMQAGAR